MSRQFPGKILQLLKMDLMKDLSFLLGGTFLAQLIPILLQPVLKRMFSVEEFGIFDIYFRSAALLIVVFSLKYDKAIVISRTKSDAASIFVGIIMLAFGFLVLSEGLILLFHFAGFMPVPALDAYPHILFLIPVTAFFFTLSNAAQMMYIREKRFLASSSLKVVRRVSEGIIQAGSGLLRFFWGLPIGEAIGNMAAAGTGLWRLRKTLKDDLPSPLLPALKKNAAEFSEFPKYATISYLLNAFVLSAMTFQIMAKFSLTEVGYAELTQRMLTVPTALFGTALSSLILQRFSAALHKKAPVSRLFFGLLLFCISIAVPFFLIVRLWGPEIFSFVFGANWTNSGAYAQMLIPSITLLFMVSPLGQILIAFKKIRLNSAWELLKFLLVAALFFIDFDHIQEYLKAYNISLLVAYAVYLLLISRTVFQYQKSLKNET